MTKKDFWKLLEEIESVRKQNKLSQEYIAAMLGVRQASYSRWISGKRTPRHPLVLESLQARAAKVVLALRARSVRMKWSRKTSKSMM